MSSSPGQHGLRPEFTRPGPDRPRRGAHELAMDLRGVGAQRSMAATRVAEPTATREEVRSAPLGRRLLSEEGPPPEPARPSVSSEPMPREVQAFAADAANIPHDRQQGTDASAPGGSGTAQLASPLLAPTAPVQQETGSGDTGVVVPAAVNPAEARRLPIYEAVESSWFSGARRAPGSARTAVKAGGNGPRRPTTAGAGADGRIAGRWIPDRGGASEAAAERKPDPGHHPGLATPRRCAEPFAGRRPNRLAGFQRGVAEGRAAASEAGEPAGESESLSVRSGRLRPGHEK